MSYRSILIVLVVTALAASLWLWQRPGGAISENRIASGTHATRPVSPLVPEDSRNAPDNPSATTTLSSDRPVPGQSSDANSSAADPFQKFSEWIKAYASAPDTERASLEHTGRVLAQARQAALRELIETDPETALAASLTWAQRRQLPASLQPWLERPINARADYAVTISDDFDGQRRAVVRETTVHGETFRTFVHGPLASQGSATGLPVNGIALGDALALSASPMRTLSPAEAAFVRATQASGDPVCAVSGVSADAFGDALLVEAGGELLEFCQTDHVNLLGTEWTESANGKWFKTGKQPTGGPQILDTWSQGPKTVLFIRVNFPDDLSEPISEADAYNLMNDVSTWIVANSYGSSAMLTTVTPLLTLPGTKAYYAQTGDGQLLTDARTVARQAGYDTADFQLDAVRFTNVPGYGYGGKAYVRGKGCWLQSSSVGVVAHEFGHNYGLWHANYWTSSQASGIGPGSHNEYGDIFDTMGSAGAGDKHFNANHRNKLDWLGDNYVRTITGSGIYRLHAFDIDQLTASRFYGLKVTKDFDRDYWIELRHRFAGNKHIQSGVLLRWDPWADSAGGAHLLDTTPGSPAGNSSKDDAAIVLGRTFVDEGAGIFITPTAMTGSGPDKSVDVAVNLGPFTGNQTPTVAVQATATQVNASEAVVFTATATDGDGDDLAYEWDFGDLNFGPNNPVTTNIWTAAGEYVVRCRVSDMKGGFASAHILVRVGNPTTYKLTGRITDGAGNPVEGVRVHNGVTTTSGYRGAFTDSNGHFVLTRLSAGTHTVSATLYGWTFAGAGAWANPVAVGPDRGGNDFTATALPAVGWTILDPSLGEAGDAATLRLSRSGPTTTALTVKYKRAGTANYTSDYTIAPAPGSTSPYAITIPVGASHVDVTVAPTQDTSSEGPETVLLALAEDTLYTLAWQAEARLEIVDDENPGKPSIYLSSGADDRATETGADTMAFTVNRSGNRTGDVRLLFTLGGVATPNVDYAAPLGEVTIPAGETIATVTFPAIDDLLVEGDETVVITATPNPAYTLSGGSTTLTIQDDDPPLVKLAVTDGLAIEGGAATARVVFQRVGSLAAPLEVLYTTSGTATSGADFTALPGMITIPAGAAAATLTLTAANDSLVEGDESLAVLVSASDRYNVGTPGVGVVVIQDNELPTVTITASDATATEGGGDPGTITVSRGSATTGDLVVSLASSGSALPGADYTVLPTTATIPSGSTSTTITVVPLDDSLKEADEKVTLTLQPDGAYNAGTTGPVSVTLKDNDSAGGPGIRFESANLTVSESQTLVRLPVVLSAASTSVVTVNYAAVGGTAQSGADFTLPAGTLSFAANQTLATISLTVANDTVAEALETLLVGLSSPVGATLDAWDSCAVTITDDDAAVVTIAAVDTSASESGDTGRLRITRTGDTSASATVLIQYSGTASQPADLASLPATVMLAAGSATADLVIDPVDDTTDELAETLTARLISISGGRLGSPATATVTIADNDDVGALPEVTFAVTDGITTEGVIDPARLSITRSGATTNPLIVNYTTGGSASAGDVGGLAGTITVPAGATTAFLDLQAVADGTVETLEELTLTLALDPAYTLGPQSAATIQVAESPFIAWELLHFTPAEMSNAAMASPEADPDADGWNNFVEYAFHRDPRRAETSPLFTQTLVPFGGTGDRLLEVTHQRRVARSDVDYSLGVADVVTGTWLEGPAHTEEVSVTPDANGVTETVHTQILAPLSHFTQRFVRLRVHRP